MPLPPTPQPLLPVTFVDDKGAVKNKAVKTKESGYAPTPEYHPTMVMVKCHGCGSVGVYEFVDGFDLKTGDDLMAGKPVKGFCFRCRGERDMVPLKLSEADAKQYRHLYNIQRALEAAVKQGRRIPANALILPVELQKKREQVQNGTARTA